MFLLFLLYVFLCLNDTLTEIIKGEQAFQGGKRGRKTKMKRTLLLDEDDLIMVVKEDVVKQIDENRGEMNRTEFVNYLIQCQLRQHSDQNSYVTKEEFQQFTSQMMELLHNFLQFFVSYGMTAGRGEQDTDIQSLTQQLESFYQNDEDTEIY
jgi:hypothetical protein